MYNIENHILQIKLHEIEEYLFSDHWFVKKDIAERTVIKYALKAVELKNKSNINTFSNLISPYIYSTTLNKKNVKYIMAANAQNLCKKPDIKWQVPHSYQKGIYHTFNVNSIGWLLFRLTKKEKTQLQWNLKYILDKPILYLSLNLDLIFGISAYKE